MPEPKGRVHIGTHEYYTDRHGVRKIDKVKRSTFSSSTPPSLLHPPSSPHPSPLLQSSTFFSLNVSSPVLPSHPSLSLLHFPSFPYLSPVPFPLLPSLFSLLSPSPLLGHFPSLSLSCSSQLVCCQVLSHYVQGICTDFLSTVRAILLTDSACDVCFPAIRREMLVCNTVDSGMTAQNHSRMRILWYAAFFC